MAKSLERVREAARAAGLELEIRRMAASTRTAEEAAAACDCDVRQIVKSLIFLGEESGELALLLVPGDVRVDPSVAATAVGEPLGRADAKLVRERTGFAIGGVSPIGHLEATRTFVDERLPDDEPLWAAAGAPDAVFATDRATLLALTGGRLGRLG